MSNQHIQRGKKKKSVSSACFTILLLLSAFILIYTPLAHAGPAYPGIIDIEQPDGTSFKARLHGDEFQSWTESVDSGHTVIHNRESGFWEYAEIDDDENLIFTGINVEPDGRSAPSHIEQKLRPRRDMEMENRHNDALKEIYHKRLVPAASSSSLNALGVSDQAQFSAASSDAWVPQPVSGTKKVLIVLVSFTDKAITTTPTSWSDDVFSTTPEKKSVANYYKDNSFGKLTISPQAHTQPNNAPGVVTVNIASNHPDGDNYLEKKWVPLAINAAQRFVNFKSLDTNQNGVIDRSELIVYFILAGYEKSGTKKTPGVHAHVQPYWNISAAEVIFPVYGMNGELNDKDSPMPIGVTTHEFGHQLLGFPDLYDTSNTNSGLGNFSLMAGGSWGFVSGQDSGATPVALDAWSREYVGWTSPLTPTVNSTVTFGAALSSANNALKLINPSVSTTEYWLAENRHPTGWDQGITGWIQGYGGGLLIMHADLNIGTPGIDGSLGYNDFNKYVVGSHQGLVPEQASTYGCDMLAADCRGTAKTTFYSGNNPRFGISTNPNSSYYSGSPSGFEINNLSARGLSMTANVIISSGVVSPPSVTSFSLPSTSDSLTVPITSFTANGTNSITGYLITENATQPSGGAAGWSSTPPASYIFTTPGTKTLYAWAKDSAGTVSNSISATVKITLLNSTGTNMLKNPDFEFGNTGWGYYSSGGYDLIWNYAGAGHNASNWYAVLGGDNNLSDYLYQGFTIPSGATSATLNFYYDIQTNETDPISYDTMKVELVDPDSGLVIAPIKTFSNRDATSGWVKSLTYNLLPYKGNDIGLLFTAVTGGSKPTVFFIDDVNLTVSVPGGDIVPPQFTAFSVPTEIQSATVPVTFSATDNVGVTGWCLIETENSDNCIWTASVPTNYIFESGITPGIPTSRTLYAWVKDTAGNISDGRSATVSINIIGSANVLENPDFESGPAGWFEYSNWYNAIITNGVGNNSSNWFAYLGGAIFLTEELYQKVTIPLNATAATLDFYYNIQTTESAATKNDTMKVQLVDPLTDSVIGELMTFSNLDATAGWTKSQPYNLIAYRGRTVWLVFRDENDWLKPTTFLIDDVNLSVTVAPNLTPYKPAGWSDKIVVSTGTGTNTDSSTISTTDTVYIDWAVANIGGVASSTPFFTDLYVDDQLRQRWTRNNTLEVNSPIGFSDYSIGALSPGNHTIRLVVDPTNTVSEGDETDNEYSRTITVVAPNLTPYKPTGWSDKIVASIGTGTNTDSNTISTTDTVYIDWAVANIGGVATAAPFYIALYVDNQLRQSWPINSSLSANAYSSLSDHSIGTLSAGAHTIKLVADSTNAVAESNESDNEYTKTITVVSRGTIQLSSATYNVSESGGTVTITATRTGGSSGAVGVSYGTGDGNAISGSDYTATQGTLSWADGDATNKTFTVNITNDTTDEVDETFTVTLSNLTGGALPGSPSSTTVTITDDDAAPTVQFSSATSSGLESATTAVLTVTLSAASAKTVTVNYATANGTATAGSDYTAISPGTVTFNPGDTSKTINVTIQNDSLDEADETFTVTLSGLTNATPGTVLSHTYMILDDDAAPTVQFLSAASSRQESVTTAVFTVTLSAASGKTVTVNYATLDGTATAGSDYTAISYGTVTFNPGEISKPINVSITDDTAVEGDETFTITLASPSNAAPGTNYTHTYTIINNDAYGSIQLSSSTYSVGESGGTVTITATRTGGSSGAVGVRYATSDGTAAAGSDFTTVQGDLTWADGDTAPKTFTVNIINDSLYEADKSFGVSIFSQTGGASLGSPADATVTIINDDNPTVQFTFGSSNESEALSQAAISVNLSLVSSQTVTVNYATSNGTATAGSDYTATSSGTLTFAPGEISKTINVPITNDSIVESNETFTVTLLSSVNATLGAISTHTYTINNDDNNGVIFFSAGSYTVSESGKTVTITVRRQGSSSGPVGVSYAISNGTAVAGTSGDYTAKPGTLSWTNGDMADKKFTVTITNDTLYEANETFNVTLSNPSGGAILGTPSTAVVTITDNDLAPKVQFSAASSTATEKTTSAAIVVTLSPKSGQVVRVNYATVNGTGSTGAIAGSDYTATSGTLTFNPGETSKTITVPIINDSVYEPSEKFTVKLSGAVNATLGTKTLHTRTITNDDAK